MVNEQTTTRVRTRKNAKFGGQPREKLAHISMTNEQHNRLKVLAGMFFISREELIRNLLDEKWEQVHSNLPALVSLPARMTVDNATLTSDSQVSGGIDE